MPSCAIIPGTIFGMCILAAASCAHSPPKELLDARAAYDKAAGGIAAQETPAKLHTAHNALLRAEGSFEENGGDEHTQDLAYVAMRSAQRAEVDGKVMRNDKTLTSLEEQKTRSEGNELDALRGQYQQQQQRLGNEQAARVASEGRAAQANADLARIAIVKQEARGMVITLSGGVMFTSGKADLLPTAQAKLSEVARGLTQQDPDTVIVVEGHTDRQGSESFNLDLSARRADAVRQYLTQHGVAADRIRSEGLGFSRPLADNRTAEGRANNRRVEIVVHPAGDEIPAH
ncbi:MAG: OmpA family protein [Polyangiales bacterium]